MAINNPRKLRLGIVRSRSRAMAGSGRLIRKGLRLNKTDGFKQIVTMQTPINSPFHIYLLGRFQVTRNGCALHDMDWKRRKASTLLQCLALERRLTKDQAIELLWPEASLTAGSNNLYPTLHALRQTLDSTLGAGTAEATFQFKDGVLSLDESVWVDVHEFRRISQLALQASPPTQAELETAVSLYCGDLLPSRLYDDWTLYARDELRRLYREVCLALANLKREQGDYPRAIALLTPLLEHNLSDEVVHRELMRTYAFAGRRHDALRQYQVCVNALHDELDVSPEAETTALYRQLLSGELTAIPRVSTLPQQPATSFIIKPEGLAPFVGRETEVQTLLAHFEAIRKQGRGKTILLTGEAGVGKTRLVYESLQRITSIGATVLYGAAYEQEEQLPYQPFIEAFEQYLAQSEHPDRHNPITNFRKLGVSDPQQEQWALFNATVTFLTDLAKAAPVVLVLDDLHAADETSLRLFHFLARQTQSTPVALIATYRIDATSAGPSPFTLLLNTLYRERLSETVELARLSEPQVWDILQFVLGGTPDTTLARAVFDISEGNPFFIQEMSYALVKSDQMEKRHNTWFLKSGVNLAVPSELGGLLRERVARLGSTVANVMTAAAVIGREFTFDILHKVVALSDGDVLDALDTALGAHLFEETEEGYRFRHALIRQTLYETLSKVRRARLHTSVAEAIETTYAAHTGGLAPYVEALAFHYDHSDQRSRALDYLIRSGEKAANVYAFEVAVNYFERALALMDELQISAPERRWPVLESLGWWCIILADTPRAVSYFELALALSPHNGWQPGNRDRARLHRGAVMTLITSGNIEAAEYHLRQALAQINEREDAQEYAHTLYNVAQFHWHKGEYQEAFEAAQKSLAIAERLNDTNAIARAFEMLALACHSLGEWQQGLTYEQQRSALAGAALDVTEAFDVHL
jgi:DNA-binding SARP family transcriptional activator